LKTMVWYWRRSPAWHPHESAIKISFDAPT
jgi:hypothetical protein